MVKPTYSITNTNDAPCGSHMSQTILLGGTDIIILNNSIDSDMKPFNTLSYLLMENGTRSFDGY